MGRRGEKSGEREKGGEERAEIEKEEEDRREEEEAVHRVLRTHVHTHVHHSVTPLGIGPSLTHTPTPGQEPGLHICGGCTRSTPRRWCHITCSTVTRLSQTSPICLSNEQILLAPSDLVTGGLLANERRKRDHLPSSEPRA